MIKVIIFSGLLIISNVLGIGVGYILGKNMRSKEVDEE